MFFDRDQKQRRQREIGYRKELKQQINLKNSKVMQKLERSYNGNQQSFSLLKNIEIEEQNRRNKKNNYYNQLRNQIQEEKQQKKRKKQEESQRQRIEEEKIRRDNQILRQRAQRERLQETKKKGYLQNSSIPTNDKSQSRIRMQQSLSIQKSQQQNYQQLNGSYKNYHSRFKTQSQNGSSDLTLQAYQSNPQIDKRQGVYSMSQLPSYLDRMDRMESESFTFLPKRKYMDSYFQELLGEKRKFEQQAQGISELNRMFYQQKARGGKIQSRGLSGLKKLQALLDQKSANYMASYSNVKNYDQYDQYDSLKKLTVPSFQNSRLKQSRWRKLD